MPRVQLQDLYPRVLTLIQSPQCDQVVKAWTFAIAFSLRGAQKLGYQTADFHEMAAEKVQQTLTESFGKLIADSAEDHVSPSIDMMAPYEKTWLGGYLYNSAVIRMAGLTERGLKILWEYVNPAENKQLHIARNAVGDYYYGQLMDWYVSVFIGSRNGKPNYASVKPLDLVRQQANDFKHDHTTVQLRRMRTMNAALDAFAKLLDLLDLTIEDHGTIVMRQTQSEWWRKNVLHR